MHSVTEIPLSDSVVAVAHKQHGVEVDLNAAERDWRDWMKKKNIRPVNPEAMFLSFLARWIEEQKNKNENTASTKDTVNILPKPEHGWSHYLAQAWWTSLEEHEKVHWRETIGQRVELEDGQGWFRTDQSIAALAFDRFICPANMPPATLPAAVIAAVAMQADVLLPQSAYDRFSAFVCESVARKPFLRDVWRGVLPQMVKDFIQQPSFQKGSQSR